MVIIIIKSAAAEISSEEPIVEEVEAIADLTKSASKGTTAVYFVKFVIELLDVMGLDKNLRKVTLLWDNASIHKLQPIFRKIESKATM